MLAKALNRPISYLGHAFLRTLSKMVAHYNTKSSSAEAYKAGAWNERIDAEAQATARLSMALEQKAAEREAHVSLTFETKEAGKLARLLVLDANYDGYIAFPDERTLIVSKPEVEWIQDLLSQKGLKQSTDYLVKDVLRMGDLRPDEVARLKDRKGPSSNSPEIIRYLLKGAEERNKKLRRQRGTD